MNLHPPPFVRPITVRESIGHLDMQGNTDDHRRKELIDAWRKCLPGKSLRKTVPSVSSFESVRLHPDRPSTTQTANHFNWHYAVPRYLTVEEMALIGAFPSGFRWPAGQQRRRKQVGNSVPPIFMRAIALHMRHEVLGMFSAMQEGA